MEIKLILTTDEVRGLLAALSNFPYKEAAPLIHKLEAQANAQLASVEAPVPAADPEAEKPRRSKKADQATGE